MVGSIFCIMVPQLFVMYVMENTSCCLPPKRVANGCLVLVRSSSVPPLRGVLGKASELIRILNPSSILNELCDRHS